MNVANIISIIGNNSSTIPILVKDGMESSAKVYLADKQGEKVSKEQGLYEAREAAIEEFGTTAIWFLGPIAIAKAFNKIAQKALGLNDDKLLNADSALLDGKHYQTLDKNLAKYGDEFIKQDATKFAKQSNLMKKLATFSKTRYTSGIAISIGLLGGLTHIKQKITENSIDKHGAPQGLSFQRHIRDRIAKHPTFAAFMHTKPENKSSEPSFKGGGGIAELAAQASIDAGIGGIRITTARDKDERKEYMFKTCTFLLFNYLTAPPVEWAFNKIAQKCNLPIGLDAKILANEKFSQRVLDASKSNDARSKLIEFINIDHSASPKSKEEKIINFIDEQIAKGKYDASGNFEGFNNETLEIARKTGIINIENKQRAVTKFVDTKQVQAINHHLKELVDSATQTGSTSNFVKKVKMTKYGAVLANIAICSTIVGVVLPKIQYAFREKGIGTVASPGVKASNHHHVAPKPVPVQTQA